MFEFFIALFGGLWSTGAILSEASITRSNQKKYNRREELFSSRRHAWVAQVVDRALQEDLWYYVIDNKEEAWLAVQDAYKGMRFQKSYSSMKEWEYDGVLDKTKAGKELYRRHRFEEPRNIMLAKHGKLPALMATNSVAYLKPGEGQRTRLEWDRTVEFWTYIRDELRRQGVDARLLFRPQYSSRWDSRPCYYDVDDIEKFRYQPGCLEWLHDTWVDSNLLPL